MHKDEPLGGIGAGIAGASILDVFFFVGDKMPGVSFQTPDVVEFG